MPSEKVTRILLSRGISSEAIDLMGEGDAWSLVYSTASKKKEKRLEVCFTGFSDVERNELAALAGSVGLHVVTTVTKALAFLCSGENAGPSKLEKAKEQKVLIMSRSQFHHFIETGEVPS